MGLWGIMGADSQDERGADDECEGVRTAGSTDSYRYPYAPVIFLLVVTVGQG